MRSINRIAACALAVLAALALSQLAAARDSEPLAFTLRTIENDAGVRIVIGFTEEPRYEVRGERGRVYVTLRADDVRPPFKRKRYSGDVLDKIRCVRGIRRSEIVFYTGPEFGSFSSFEMRDPFRLILDLRRERPDAAVQIPPPEAAGGTPRSGRDDATPPGELEDEDFPSSPDYLPGDAGAMGRPPNAAFVVVLDPGHGGAEDGARGPTGLLEKDVTLDIARRLKRRLEEGMDVTVLLTRDDDRDVPLDDRTAIANNKRADLFVSIHANASRRTNARGAETYFLSREATDDESRIVAGIENNAMGLEEGVQGNGDLELVLWELAQSAFLKESSSLAETIQDRLNDALGISNRGIKQAPFRVLMGAMMPAVLVEIAFISNPDEERRLRDPDFKERLATALFDSIRRYERQYARERIPR